MNLLAQPAQRGAPGIKFKIYVAILKRILPTVKLASEKINGTPRKKFVVCNQISNANSAGMQMIGTQTKTYAAKTIKIAKIVRLERSGTLSIKPAVVLKKRAV